MVWHYDEISPITGNKSVVVSGKNKLCLESGYELFHGDLVKFEQFAPVVILESKFISDSAEIWYKTMRISNDSVLIPLEDGWEVNSWKDLEDDSGVSYEIMREIRTETHKFTQVLDHMTAKFYEKFIDAFDEFNKRANQEL